MRCIVVHGGHCVVRKWKEFIIVWNRNSKLRRMVQIYYVFHPWQTSACSFSDNGHYRNINNNLFSHCRCLRACVPFYLLFLFGFQYVWRTLDRSHRSRKSENGSHWTFQRWLCEFIRLGKKNRSDPVGLRDWTQCLIGIFTMCIAVFKAAAAAVLKQGWHSVIQWNMPVKSSYLHGHNQPHIT